MKKIAKVPVVMQMEATECGAASLCMILAYYGKWLPVVLNLGMMVFSFCIMVRYSTLLTVIGLITAALNLFVTQYVLQKRINLARAQMRDEGKLAATTMSGNPRLR